MYGVLKVDLNLFSQFNLTGIFPGSVRAGFGLGCKRDQIDNHFYFIIGFITVPQELS